MTVIEKSVPPGHGGCVTQNSVLPTVQRRLCEFSLVCTAAHSLTLRLNTHAFLTHTYTFLIFQPLLKGHGCYLDDPYNPFPGPDTTRLSEPYLSSLDS